MTTINKRRHERVKHKAKIRVLTTPVAECILERRDFSESGLYLFCTETNRVQLADEVEVQTLEMDDAPILKSKLKMVKASLSNSSKLRCMLV